MRRFRITPVPNNPLRRPPVAKMFRLVLLPVSAADRGQRICGDEDRRGQRAAGNRRIRRSQGDHRQAREPIRQPIKTADQERSAPTSRKLQEKFNKDGDVMSDAEKRKLQKEIEDKQIEYQFRVNKLQKVVNERQQEILSADGAEARCGAEGHHRERTVRPRDSPSERRCTSMRNTTSRRRSRRC